MKWLYAKRVIAHEKKEITVVDNLRFISEYSMHEFMQRHKKLIKRKRPDLWLSYLMTEKKVDYSRYQFDYSIIKKKVFNKECGKGIHIDYNVLKRCKLKNDT